MVTWKLTIKKEAKQVVKVIWHKSTSPLHMDGSVVFARWQQCAPPCNTCLLWPTWAHNPNGILVGSAVFAQLMAQCSRACMVMSFPTKNYPFAWGFGPPSNTCFLWPSQVHNSNGISIVSAVFAQLMANSPYFTMGAPFSKYCPFPWGIWTPI